MMASKIALIIAFAILALAFMSWLICLLWWWTVPDVFSGAVASGIVPATITLGQAFKLSCLLGVLISAAYGSKKS